MATTEFQLSTYMRARLETWESDVSTTDNTSKVNARIKVWRTNSWSGQTYSSSVRRVITIDGTNVCDWTGEISHYVSYGEIEVASGSKTVTHNNDGSKSVGVSCSLTDNVGAYFSGSGSLTMSLTTIARASEPTLSASTFNIGDTITINTNRKSSSFTHTITLTFGSYAYTVGTGVGTSVSLNTANIASSLYAQIPSATSGTGSITCTTYNGSTNIGSKSVSFTAKAVEANAKPTFSNFTYQDTNSTITAITGNNQYLVQGKSNLRVTISSANKAVAKYSATMSAYNASISGLSASANYSTSDLNIDFSSNVFTAGTQALSVRATDSRGYSTSVSKNVNVLAYAAPVVNATATRLNNFENQTTLVVKGSYSPLTINGTAKNTVSSVQYRYKSQSTSTWGSWNSMSGLSVNSGGTYTTTDKVLDLDNSTAYDFEVKATDKLGSTTVTLVVSVGVPIFRIGTDGNVYNNEKRILNTGDLPIGTANIANSAINATKLNWTAFNLKYKNCSRVDFTSPTAWQAYYPSGWDYTFTTVKDGIYLIVWGTEYLADVSGVTELDFKIHAVSGGTELLCKHHVMTDANGEARIAYGLWKATGTSLRTRAWVVCGSQGHSIRLYNGSVFAIRVG